MKSSGIYKRATNPLQYDLQDLSWENEEKLNSTRILFFKEYLKKYFPKWKNKKILEIGSGTGWLLQEAKKAKASLVEGIEPSQKNVKLSKVRHPKIQISETSLEKYKTDKKFNIVLAVMSFSHISNLKAAFKQISAFLEHNGELIIVVPDYVYFSKQRHNYKVKSVKINANEYAVSVNRKTGILADIVRKNSVYIKIASQFGFLLKEEIPMLPTNKFLKSELKYNSVKHQPLCQLLKFKVK